MTIINNNPEQPIPDKWLANIILFFMLLLSFDCTIMYRKINPIYRIENGNTQSFTLLPHDVIT